MKLRLRSLQSKETLKIEVSNSCTLQELKQTLCQTLSYSSPSLRLSLNRKDELQAPSPQDSLRSLGIASGDLIYFSLNPNDFTSGSSSYLLEQTQRRPGNLCETMFNTSVNSHEPEKVSSNIDGEQETAVESSEVSCEESKLKESEVSQIEGGEYSMSDTQMEKIEGVDIDSSYVDDADVKRFSEPCFLRRILREEFGDVSCKSKLLVIAVHAVLLDSGFVGLDSEYGRRIDLFNLTEDWPSKVLRLSYTLPELLGNQSENVGIAPSVMLWFQTLATKKRKFVNVYGCLTNGPGQYEVRLDEDRFAPVIDIIWANRSKDDRKNIGDGLTRSYTESEVIEFWKIVKDGFSFPLLIDLCDNSGLTLPSCFMRLPTDLKFKILELLPGVDIARMANVCSEMRYLSSCSDLWKLKFEEEFGSAPAALRGNSWKLRFAELWVHRKECEKKRKWEINARPRSFRRFHYPVIWRDPSLPFPSPIVGGDFDRFPVINGPSPFGRLGQGIHRFQTRRNFSPNCNLGGPDFEFGTPSFPAP